MVMVISTNHPCANKKHVTPNNFIEEHLLIHSLPFETLILHQNCLVPANVWPKNNTTTTDKGSN